MGEYLRVVWRRKWRVLAVAMVLAGVVYARSSSRPERYEATALLSVSAGTDDESGERSLFLARSYASLAETRVVVGEAVTSGDLQLERSEARDRVEAEAADDVGFLSVRAIGASVDGAEKLAQAVADALVTTVRTRQEKSREELLAPAVKELTDLERQLGARDVPADAPVRPALTARYQELSRAITEARLSPLDRVEVVAPARASTSPISPTPSRDALVTFLLALGAFSIVALVLEQLSDRFSTERPAEEAVRVTGLPVLAEIPRTAGPEVIEGFRSLRTSLMFMSTSERLRTLAMVSVDPSSGKTFVALNLARETSSLEVPVVLIDGDLRRPVIHDRLGLPRSPGLSEALAGAAGITELSGHMIDGWLRIVPSGAQVPDPAGLFGGRAFRDALDGMTWAELVVVDTPAAGLFADALAIASQCDATIVVIDTQQSRRRPVRRLVESLRQVSAQPIGVVLNRTDPVGRSSYYDKPSRKSASTQSRTVSTT